MKQHESDFLPAINHSSSVLKNEEKWGVNGSTLKAFSSSSEKGFLVSRNLNKVWYQRQAKSSTSLHTQKKEEEPQLQTRALIKMSNRTQKEDQNMNPLFGGV
jgi:hypothetical protein